MSRKQVFWSLVPVLLACYILTPAFLQASTADWDALETDIESLADPSAEDALLGELDAIRAALAIQDCAGYDDALASFADQLMTQAPQITDAEWLLIDGSFSVAINAETICPGRTVAPVAIRNRLKCQKTGLCQDRYHKDCYQRYIKGRNGKPDKPHCRQKVS